MNIEQKAIFKLKNPESIRKLRQHIRRSFIVRDSQGQECEISPIPFKVEMCV